MAGRKLPVPHRFYGNPYALAYFMLAQLTSKLMPTLTSSVPLMVTLLVLQQLAMIDKCIGSRLWVIMKGCVRII